MGMPIHGAMRVMVPVIAERSSLVGLEQFIRKHSGDIVFDFSKCLSLRPSATAVLGGLARLVQHQGYRADFDWLTCSHSVLLHVAQNGFSQSFGGPTLEDGSHAIPYREDRANDANAIVNYLRERWLGRGWMNISAGLCEAILGTVWEIYANAIDHSRCEIGVMTCGHHYEHTKELSLTVVDLGIGIPANVQEYAQRNNLSGLSAAEPSECLEWAFRRGTTTQEGLSRGLGLDLLRRFVKLNDGRLECFSGGAEAIISRDADSFGNAPSFFRGTLVTITLRCDRRFYRLASETDVQKPLF
jgi:hypothetical protein